MESQSLFSPPEYLTTFTTFIYGYVATQFLSGWSSMITHRKTITFSKEHLVWTILFFVLLIDIWWTSWRKTEIIANDNLLFYSTLITPFIFYFLSHLLFPDLNLLFGNNLKTYLTPITRKVMMTLSLLLLSFLLSDLIFPKHLPQNNLFIFGGILLTSVLIIFPSAIFLRRGVLMLGCCILVGHLFSLVKFEQPFSQIGGFSFVEYLTVFITFIYGFVTWRFLEGWGMIITNYRKLKIGYDFVPWTIVAFLLLLDMWWGTWAREDYLSKNILYFFLSLTVPILYYFQSAVIFPIELLSRGYGKLNQYYYRNNRIICLFFGLILLSNSVVANLMEETTFLSLKNFFRFSGVLLSGIAMTSSKLLNHRIVLAVGLVTIVVHAFTD